MSITSDIERGCKDGQGGVDVFYICPYVKYSRTQIVIEGQYLTSYPATIVYQVYSSNTNYTENSSFEGGSEKWEQNFTFEVPKTDGASEIYKLLRQNIIIFHVDRLNNIRVLGLKNGLECQITNETGTNKGDFNGYRVTANGLENNQAYFITDLAAIGIQIGEVFNFVYQDDNNYVFQDDNNFIFE